MTRYRKARLRRAILATAGVLTAAGFYACLALAGLFGLILLVDARVDHAWQARMGAAVVVPLPPADVPDRLGIDCPRCI